MSGSTQVRLARIIPVIDLMGGIAVHARAGQRTHYRPLQSPLCSSAEAVAVIDGLLRLHPFTTVYVADLDALMGRGNQHEQLRILAEAHPELEFWLDAGWPPPDGPWTAVIGSESLDARTWDRLQHRETDWILSLDFFEGRLKGEANLLGQPDRWPARVIVMSLNQVGGFTGPDWERLLHIRGLAPEKTVIAAGGVRDGDDLLRLRQMGIETALVASALHAGRLHGNL